jgi:hypothetical protein
MPKNLLSEIASPIADFVNQRGMRVVVERQDQASFGNAVVEVTSPDFDLRIVRDRGQVALDVSASGQGEWHSLENVLAFICKEPPPADIPLLIRRLSENLDKVAALMTSDLNKVGFTDFDKQWSASFLKRLFPPT